jgi:hypothetical protein
MKRVNKLINTADLLEQIGLEDNEENRDNNAGEVITLEDVDRVPPAGEKLFDRLMGRIDDSAVNVSTAKIPHTYMSAVVTRQLQKILEEELLGR